MNSSAAATKATAARLVRAGTRTAATLLAAGVLALTAQGTAHATEARPAAHDRTASPAATAPMPNLAHLPQLPGVPALPQLPSLPGGVLGPIVDALNGDNHDWGVPPRG